MEINIGMMVERMELVYIDLLMEINMMVTSKRGLDKVLEGILGEIIHIMKGNGKK